MTAKKKTTKPSIADLKPASQTIRNRIKEFVDIPVDELKKNSKNWRLHPKKQSYLLERMIDKIGVASAVIAYDDPEFGITIIDGHLRQSLLSRMAPGETVPVLMLDVTRDEADAMLATMDSVAAMAKTDKIQAQNLLAGLEDYLSDIDHCAMQDLSEAMNISFDTNPDAYNFEESTIDTDIINALNMNVVNGKDSKDQLVMFHVPEIVAKDFDAIKKSIEENLASHFSHTVEIQDHESWILAMYLAYMRMVVNSHKSKDPLLIIRGKCCIDDLSEHAAEIKSFGQRITADHAPLVIGSIILNGIKNV